MPIEVVVTEEPTQADRDTINAGLAAYNESRIGRPIGSAPLGILLRDDAGATIGGLYGRYGFDWLLIERVFIPESMRGKDVGTELMRRAEEAARARNCVGMRLDTHQFQAREFYEKLGFEVVGIIDDHPPGWQRYFMRKLLSPVR